eukprot:Gb_25126 [translate_table: standard]
MAQPIWIHQKKRMLLFQQPMPHRPATQGTFNTMANTIALQFEQLHASANDTSPGIYADEDWRTLFKQSRSKGLFMNDRGIGFDDSAYASLLQGCHNNKSLPEAKLVHAHMIQTGFKPEIIIETNLLTTYAKCGSLMNARRVFDEMSERNVVSWTAMITACSRYGLDEDALSLFYQMQLNGMRPNHFSFSSVLPACANLAALKLGKEFHEQIIRSGFESNVFVGSALVDMYVKCDNVEEARKVFDKMTERNVVSWNTMITGYAQNGQVVEALELFENMPERNVISWTSMIGAYARHGRDEKALALFCQMQRTGIQPDKMIFASVLPACANLASLEHGKVVHEVIIRSGFLSDVFVGSALVDMYIKCGSIENACKTFHKMPKRNVVSWNTMIAGYAQNGRFDDALKLFQEMPEQDVVSWNALITGYAQNGYVDEAMKLFQKMPERNVVSWTAMITGYAQNMHVEEALELFRTMPEQNVISWNAIIVGYAQNGQFYTALKLFRQMRLTYLKPNSVTFASILSACGNLAALEDGKEVHEDIIRSIFLLDIVVENALVDMYAKCGCIENARKVFDKMPIRNVVSWSTMIAGYGMHGYGKEAIQLFEQMQYSGTKPNRVTFTGVLSACCHAGLVHDGYRFFECMSRDYHITPALEHYCCMVDLLGRAGCLIEAQDFVNKMPIEPDAAVWLSLLGACRIHTNVELGELVAEQLFALDPKNAAHYVLLSNIYAAAGRWDDVENVRKMMKDRKVKKIPGYSWIEVNNKVHASLIGNKSHPQTQSV